MINSIIFYCYLLCNFISILGTLFGLGDAVATIAAQSSTGTEFFITDMNRGRLNFQQRNFSGNRYSDHIAQLNAFQAWEEARQGGENAEINFCDHKSLNMPTLRTTWEAKKQLTDLLIQSGFPEETMVPQVFNFTGIFHFFRPLQASLGP